MNRTAPFLAPLLAALLSLRGAAAPEQPGSGLPGAGEPETRLLDEPLRPEIDGTEEPAVSETGESDVPTEPPSPPVTEERRCTWEKVWRYEKGEARDSQQGFAGWSFAESLALAYGAFVNGGADASSASLVSGISTAVGVSSSGILHVFRTDETDCQSRIGFRMKVKFRARAEVSSPAAAGAAGYQSILAAGARVEVQTSGGVETASSSSALPLSVSIGPVRIVPTVTTAKQVEQEFIDIDQGSVPSRDETFLFAGACSVHASAGAATPFTTSSGSSVIDECDVSLDVECICLAPCAGTMVAGVHQGG